MASEDVFEAVEYCEPALQPGERFPGTQETVIGEFGDEVAAVKAARAAWAAFRDAPSRDVMWWLVRRRGEPLALWIADGHSAVERVLDLTTSRLIEVE